MLVSIFDYYRDDIMYGTHMQSLLMEAAILRHQKFPDLKVRQTNSYFLKCMYFIYCLFVCLLFIFFILCYSILRCSLYFIAFYAIIQFFIITSVYISCFVTYISFKIFKRHITIIKINNALQKFFNYPKPLFTSHSNIQKPVLSYDIFLFYFILFYFICCNFICCYFLFYFILLLFFILLHVVILSYFFYFML